MKKILIALLALCMLVCFVACGGDDEPAETTGADSGAPIETTAPAENKDDAETTEKVQVGTDDWSLNY